MDKYEYKLKLEQMKSALAEGNIHMAEELADSISWKRVRNANSLMKAAEVYEAVERYEDAKELLMIAYEHAPIGRMIVYRLAELELRTGNYDEAEERYREFVEMAPNDNLKYVLKYRIYQAKGAPIDEQIKILEDLKEQEYIEEWAYELAYLYHQAGRSEECIEACDELILWFGDGAYVEKALELKMLYQPLTRQQEEKYRQFRQKRDGIVEVRPNDMLRSGEIVPEVVKIPQVTTNASRFNTVNLQKELAKNMQQIMDATEKEEVNDSMDAIKKMVEDIPYLQLPHNDEGDDAEKYGHIETDAEIDGSLKINFKELLAEDSDGQISLYVPKDPMVERQITGQMSIQDVLEEWEKTKRAAETALQDAQQRKLESAKARALKEAEDIMERLVEVIPQLDAGISPKELLEQEYMQGISEEDGEEKTVKLFKNVNNILSREIEKLSRENNNIDRMIKDNQGEEPEALQDGSQGQNAELVYDGAQGGTPEGIYDGAQGENPEEIYDGAQGGTPEGIYDEAQGGTPEGIYDGAQGENPEGIYDGAQGENPEAIYNGIQGENPEAIYNGIQGESANPIYDGMQGDNPGAVYDGTQGESANPIYDGAQGENPEPIYDGNQGENPGLIHDGSQAENPGPIYDGNQGENPGPIYDGNQGENPEPIYDGIQGEGLEGNVSQEVPQAEYENPDPGWPQEAGTHPSQDLDRTVSSIEQSLLNTTIELPRVETDPQELFLDEDIPNSPAFPETFQEEATEGEEELPSIQVPEDVIEGEDVLIHLSAAQKELFSYFIPIHGMEQQLCQVLTGVKRRLTRSQSSAGGNIIIQGGPGSGKTVLATHLIQVIQQETGKVNGKVGKIDASSLNQKDIPELVKKIRGGCLIIEKAGNINRETAVKLSLQMAQETGGMLVILEDSKEGIRKALGRDEGFARKFTERINIPIFSIDELVEFAKSYAKELGYGIDDMGILALYNRISSIEKLDEATTLFEVKDIVDEAVANSEKGGLKKAFSAFASRHRGQGESKVLREKDFEES